MKKLFYYIEFGILGMVVWIILYENLSLYTVVSGFLLGAAAALFANIFLTTEKLTSAYRFNFPILGIFIVVLIYRIFKAGIAAIPDIIKGRCNTSIVDIETKVPEGMASTTLANSITLTPGTVTIEKTGQKIKVLWLNKSTDDPVEAARVINGSLEKILIRAAKHD